MGTQLPQLAQPFPNFRPMSVMAELLDGSRCYLLRRYSSWPRGHYVSWGPAAPPKGGGTQHPSTFWPGYCIQTAGWIKMPLGVEVGLGPDHIVLGGDPAPPFLPQKQDTPIFGACLLWTNGCMVQHAIIRCLHEAIVAAIGRTTTTTAATTATKARRNRGL